MSSLVCSARHQGYQSPAGEGRVSGSTWRPPPGQTAAPPRTQPIMAHREEQPVTVAALGLAVARPDASRRNPGYRGGCCRVPPLPGLRAPAEALESRDYSSRRLRARWAVRRHFRMRAAAGGPPMNRPRHEEGATFAAPSRHALDNARQTLGPVGVREMPSTIWAKSFSLPSIAISACARTPTSVLSSSTTGKRRT